MTIDQIETLTYGEIAKLVSTNHQLTEEEIWLALEIGTRKYMEACPQDFVEP